MWIADEIGCVDRLDDYAYLSGAMTCEKQPVSGFALYGRSGIGKTYISDLLASRNVALLPLEVSFSATDSAVIDGVAQRTIGLYLHNTATQKKRSFPTFERWLKTYSKKDLLERLLEDIYDDFKEKHARKLAGIPSLIEYFTATGKFSPARVFDAKVGAGVSLSSQYVMDSLVSNPFFCRIRNAQKIDEVSCDFLSELVFNSKGSKVIFEFTCDEVDGKMQRVIDVFGNRDLVVKPHAVGIIDFDEFKNSFLNLPPREGNNEIDSMIIESARERYAETSGNVLDMLYHVDTLLLGCSKTTNISLKGTRAKLNQVRDIERIIISMLALHGGAIKSSRLKALLGRQILFSHKSLAHSIADLISKQLVRKRKNTYMLLHDDVSHQILTWDEYSRAVQLVAKDMVGYFEDELANNKSKSEYIEIVGRLIHLNSVVEDAEALRSLLAELERKSASFLSPEEARRALMPIWKMIKGTENNSLLHLKAAYCTTAYNSRLYQEAHDSLSLMPQDEHDVRLMQAAVLNRMDEHDHALKCCAAILSDSSISSDRKIHARIVAIYAYRSKCEFEACYQVFRQGKSKLNGSPVNQALFLRTAEVILRADLSLPYLQASKRQFRKSGQTELWAYACIDLGMQLGRLGNVVEARRELKEADELLAVNPTQRFAVSNNLAVINMNEGIFDDDTISLLLYTQKTSTIVFDKLAAKMNLLIAYTMRNERDSVRQTFDDLLKGVGGWEKRDQGLLELIGCNMAWSTKTLKGDPRKILKFKQYQQQYLTANHWTWKNTKFGPIPGEYMLPNKPYRVCWLSPWHFPMSIKLQHQ